MAWTAGNFSRPIDMHLQEPPPHAPTPIRVLLVEDNPADARLLIESLREAGDGFHVSHVVRLSAAVEELRREESAVDVVALDLSLPDSTGLETVRRLRAAAPGMPIVVLTGVHDEKLGLDAVRQGVQDFLVKGYHGDHTARALRYAVERKRAEEALRQSESRLTSLFEALPVGVAIMDVDGKLVVSNREMGRYLTNGTVPSRDDARAWRWQANQPDGRPLERGDFPGARAMRGERVVPGVEFRYMQDDGTELWTQVSAVPLRATDGRITGNVVVVTDIDAVKQAEEDLRESRTRLAAVVETAVDAIITIDEHGLIDSVNPATERLFGYPAPELLGRNVALLMPEPYAGEHDGYLRRYVRTGEARIIGIGREVIGLRKDGSTFPLSLSVSEFHVGGRRMFTGMLHDITNRRRLEREILEASANEQRRIGHELHDGICQQILGASFGMEVLAQRLEEDRGARKQAPAVRKLMALLNDTLTQARALSHGLNPIDLRAGGLGKALSDLGVRISETFKIDCRVREARHEIVADATTSTHLYRIAQEAISNAIKHGRSKRVDVELSGTADGWLTLNVTDDGSGMPASLPPTAGRGLQIMRYRAALIGASIAVRGGATGGTVVACTLRLPYQPAASDSALTSPPVAAAKTAVRSPQAGTSKQRSGARSKLGRRKS